MKILHLIRSFATRLSPVTAQALVVEVYVLYQSSSDMSLAAEFLKKAFWLSLFNSVFGGLPFAGRTATLTVQLPSTKPTTICSGLVPTEGLSNTEVASATGTTQSGILVKYKVTENSSAVYDRYYKDGKLTVSASTLIDALNAGSSKLPFGGSLKLVLLSCYIRTAKVSTLAVDSKTARVASDESKDD